MKLRLLEAITSQHKLAPYLDELVSVWDSNNPTYRYCAFVNPEEGRSIRSILRFDESGQQFCTTLFNEGFAGVKVPFSSVNVNVQQAIINTLLKDV